MITEELYNYEEFFNSVEKQVLQSCSAFPVGEVKAFLKENEQDIVEEYEDAIKHYKSGDYTVGQVTRGAASSVANCLSLMF